MPGSLASQDALTDLLGALAYAELSAFDRLAADSRMAPTLDGRARMSAMAAAELGHFGQLADRLRERGIDPGVAMTPFVAALDSYHTLTEPSTWLEAVVKAYVGDGIAADFYREVSTLVDAPTNALILEVLRTSDRAEFAVQEVRSAVAEQPAAAGRLALWARRLVGEAISQTQHVLADRDSLMMLLAEGAGGLSGVGALIARITAEHELRLRALGLGS